VKVLSDEEMQALGATIGAQLKGGEILELIGDVGAGKTTFVKGLARGLGVTDDVQSPSFTINRNYTARDGLTLNHYDFYRLKDAGIMAQEIAESLAEPHNITVVEWGESVRDILPTEHTMVRIDYLPEEGRKIILEIPQKFQYLSSGIEP
jgi:tRNA threonylcarbamoyladenosine biosynthesis protein TsaE